MLSDDVFQRLFQKDTVNSIARRMCNRNYPDALDLVLSSVYNHERSLFFSKFDTIMQIENTKQNPIKEKLFEELIQMEKANIHHPLITGKNCID